MPAAGYLSHIVLLSLGIIKDRVLTGLFDIK